MKNILNQINDIPGVKGSIVIDKEGLVIASNLMSGLEEKTISALVAVIYAEIVKSLTAGREQDVYGVQLHASGGSIIFLCASYCILIVITESGANMGLISIKMKASIERIIKLL